MESIRFLKPYRYALKLFFRFSTVILLFVLSGCILTVPYPAPIPCGATEELIKAIEFANTDPNTLDVIELDANCKYEIDAVYDNSAGNTGLPHINTPVKIIGNGSIISRKGGPSDEKFRIFYVGPAGDLTLVDLTLLNGYAYNPNFTSDTATNSGGAVRNQGQLNLDKVTIEKNDAHGVAGGIFNEGNLVILDSTIHLNEQVGFAYTMGGATAIHNKLGASAVVYRSTIAANGIISGPWNAISNDENASISFENSTIDGNYGTGINNDGNLDLMYVTISENQLGIWSVWYGIPKVNMTGTLFMNATDCSIGSGVLVKNLFNMDSDGSCGVAFSVLPTQMLLGPLNDNGGATFTRALQAGSPAINAVNGVASRVCPIAEDQRGVARPQYSLCDIGAYEYDGPMLSPVPPPSLEAPAPLATPTYTPAPEASPSRCELFDGENASLTLFDIPYGTSNMSLYVLWPHPVWGLEAQVIGDDQSWIYMAELGDSSSSECTYQGYSGRLYCNFKLPESDLGAALELKVFINGCDHPIYHHSRVSIMEPDQICRKDDGKEACEEFGGTYDNRNFECICP